MIKFKVLAFVAAALFAGSSAFAHDGDKACCADHAGKNMKAACAATFTNLNLTADQQGQMEKLADGCVKSGCTKESMASMEKSAKGILSAEQFATWRAACSAKTSEKKQG